jgi:hypothetical protein
VYQLSDGVGSVRYFSIFVLLWLPAVVAAGGPLTPRPLDPIATDAFERALARSALVRSLVATLETSNVIVHNESAKVMPAGIGGTTRFVTSRGGYRYVRITIGADLAQPDRTAILGHELQHACEIANTPADDVASLRQVFAREGRHDGKFFETARAIETEKRIRLEMAARPARQGARLPAGSAGK